MIWRNVDKYFDPKAGAAITAAVDRGGGAHDLAERGEVL